MSSHSQNSESCAFGSTCRQWPCVDAVQVEVAAAHSIHCSTVGGLEAVAGRRQVASVGEADRDQGGEAVDDMDRRPADQDSDGVEDKHYDADLPMRRLEGIVQAAARCVDLVQVVLDIDPVVALRTQVPSNGYSLLLWVGAV